MTEVTQAGRLGKSDHVMALTKGNISPSAHAGGVASPQLAQTAINHTKRESLDHLKEKVHHLVSKYVPETTVELQEAAVNEPRTLKNRQITPE